jgi:hypothetical protein
MIIDQLFTRPLFEAADPNRLIVTVTIPPMSAEDDAEVKDLDFTGRFQGDARSQINQAIAYLKKIFESKGINFTDFQATYQGQIVNQQNRGSMEPQNDAERELHSMANQMRARRPAQNATPIVKENRSDPITQFASNAHEQWRRNFDPTGTKPRIKKNSDGTEGDINVPFADLHPDWKKENLAAGHAAHQAVKHFGHDMEKAAEHVHNEWMKRNPKADYNAAQHVPYEQLPDDEKEKDRVHVRTMMRLMGHHPKQGVTENTMFGDDQAFIDSITDSADKEKYLNQLKKTKDIWALSSVNKSLRTAAYSEIYKLKDLKKQLSKKYNIASNVDDEAQGMAEVAPPGAKAERMVRHIKQGYAKDGKLTPKEKGIAFATAWKAHNAGRVEEATGDERFDSMMGQIQREPRIPDSQMPPTDVKDLYHWAVKHHKPYHKIFAKWANREGFKSVAPALQKAGNLDSDALDYWTPDVWKLWYGPDSEMPRHWSKERVPEELRDYLETVFDAYDRIVFDWPTEYRQISEQGVTEGLTEMDKSEPSAGRDTGPREGPEKIAKTITKEKMVKHASDILSKSMAKKDDKKKDVKESDGLPQWKKDWYAKQKPNSFPKHPQPYHKPDWMKDLTPSELEKLRGKKSLKQIQGLNEERDVRIKRIQELCEGLSMDDLAKVPMFVFNGLRKAAFATGKEAAETKHAIQVAFNWAQATPEQKHAAKKQLHDIAKIAAGLAVAAAVGHAGAAALGVHHASTAVGALAKTTIEHIVSDLGIEAVAEILASAGGINIVKNALHDITTSSGHEFEKDIAAQDMAQQQRKHHMSKVGTAAAGAPRVRSMAKPTNVPQVKRLPMGMSMAEEADPLMKKLRQALIREGRVKELADDLKTMSDADFMKKYGKAKAAIRRDMKRVDEAEDTTAGQQFVGTGTSSNRQMSVDIAAMNARRKAAQSIAGTANFPNGVLLPAGTKYGPQDTKSDGAGKYVSTYTITLPAPSQSAEPAPAAPANNYLDSSPATSGATGSMSTGAPAAVGPAAGNYMKVNELSTNKLSQYKTAAAKDAKKADQAGDFKRGDKRLSGMVQATKKQFDNDAKKVEESRAARRALMARIVNHR